MSKQTEGKVDIWPRHPSVLTFKELSEADFKRMYLTAPKPGTVRPKVAFENYRELHKGIDYICRRLEICFHQYLKESSQGAVHSYFKILRGLEKVATSLSYHGEVVISFFNPELLRQDQVKFRIDPAVIREKPIFNGFDLADSHDRTEIMTFTPQTPPFKVAIKAVIT